MRLKQGMRLGGYVIERLCGQGGAAAVWAVRDVETGERSALKVLTRSDPELVRRLQREGRAQAALHHPHLLPVLEILEVEGLPALRMPLVEGPTLQAVLAERRLSADEALALLAAILDGVGHAHAAGLAHRDLKPANVLLERTAEGIRPRVADFGLVRPAVYAAEDLATRQGAVLGTPAYAAPEQLRDASAADGRADVFSLGVVLVELSTGRRPFPGHRLAEVIEGRRRPPDLEGLEPSLRALASAMLSSDPADRPTIVEARAALPAPSGGDPLAAGEALDETCRSLGQPGAAAPMASATFREEEADGAGWTPSFLGSVAPPGNLPVRADEFLGREEALADLEARLASGVRLLTLTGPGGAGKTRLALELGRRVAGRWAGGVWLIPLAEARDEDDVLAVLGRVLEVPLGRDPRAWLLAALRGRGQVLLLLDNAEQVSVAVASVVQGWLPALPRLGVVVTSRRPLGLPEEACAPVPPLPPEPAAALFLARSREVRPDLGRTEEVRRDALALAELLDGLPLAIELAAARSRLFSPRQLRERLARTQEGLRGDGSREGPAHHRTLRTSVEWSWRLLTPPEQAVLAACATFEGGFRVEAAEAVADLSPWPAAPPVEEILDALVRHSLLAPLPTRVGGGHGGLRLGMLSSVQQIVASLADDPGLHVRHAAWCLGVAEGERAAELSNLVAACRRAVARGDGPVAVEAAVAAAGVYRQQGPFEAGLALLRQAAPLPGGAPYVRAMLINEQARLLYKAGRHPEGLACLQASRALLEAETPGILYNELGTLSKALGRPDEALSHYRRALEEGREGVVLCNLALLHAEQGRTAEAEVAYRESLSRAVGAGDRALEGGVRVNLGLLLFDRGEIGEARALLREGRALCQQTGQRAIEGAALLNLGLSYAARGQLDEAGAFLLACLRHVRPIGARLYEGVALSNLGKLARSQGRLAEAERYLEDALALHRELRSPRFEAITLGYLGSLLEDQGRPAEALRYHEQATAVLRTLGDQRFLGSSLVAAADLLADADPAGAERRLREAIDIGIASRYPQLEGGARGVLAGLLAARGDLDAGRAELDRGEVLLRAHGYTAELALLACTRVELERLPGGDPEAAGRALAEARRLAEALNTGEHTTLHRRLRSLQGGSAG